jgi:hypothetical protein
MGLQKVGQMPRIEKERAPSAVYPGFPVAVRPVGHVEAAMVPVAVLDAPVRGRHSGGGAHGEVEQNVEPFLRRERMMDVEVEDVVHVADHGEDDERRDPESSVREAVPEGAEQDDRRGQPAHDVQPVGWMTNQHCRPSVTPRK